VNKEIKATWLDALTSGQYTQAKDALRLNNTHCCLGVLCDLYSKATGKGAWVVSAHSPSKALGVEDFEVDGVVGGGLPPPAVIEWAGLNDEAPTVRTPHGQYESLALLNDTGKSFGQIAELIEEQL
jgi:hypothetical protein